MIKKVLTGLVSLSLTSTVAAIELPTEDSFKIFLKSKIVECKNHFDIEAYFLAAIGVKVDERITEEVLENLENFKETGQLSISKSDAKDNIAVECANFTEGILMGSIGRQLMFDATKAEGANSAVNGMSEALNKAMQSEE